MLAWFRDRAAPMGAVALAAFALGSGAVGVHGAHDAEDLLIAVEHDASAHRYAAEDGAAPGHRLDCLACHWSRSVRLAAEAVFVAGPGVDAVASVRARAVILPAPARAVRPPLRAPPAPVPA